MNKSKANRKNKGKMGVGGQGLMQASVQTTGIIARSMPLFGYRKRVTIPYYSNISLATGAGVAGAYVFSANGCFDPDITSTGGQPMGFDQMMVFFNHYTVLRSRITVTVSSAAAANNVVAGLAVSGSSTVTTSVQQLLENGDCEFVTLGYAGQMGSTAKLTRQVVSAKFQGIEDVMDDPNMRGDAASNPAEQFYYHIFAYAQATGSALQTYGQVRIEYDVMFHEPRKGSISAQKPVITRVGEHTLSQIDDGKSPTTGIVKPGGWIFH
jgi:hypothetical protein